MGIKPERKGGQEQTEKSKNRSEKSKNGSEKRGMRGQKSVGEHEKMVGKFDRKGCKRCQETDSKNRREREQERGKRIH